MLSAIEAVDFAEREAAALARDPQWTAAFTAATPMLPVLVKNETRPTRDYYLVDFRKNGDFSKLTTTITGLITEVTTSFVEGGTPELAVAGYDHLFPMTLGN